ncbi:MULTISPECIES: helix-turn-helix transcriptional regulator [unclassified Streptomyces]|uniref:helix-turn-helix domain-containing protein n=1 Tax=unclassified Streptomyces TaxID=2593676 RepID=UPI00236667E3|nr:MULTISPECIES: helix-turn-helix transcriptional regulator [unclassified Streptomyces]MDF3141833.1 helix-turn-helix transcriptional regulator [Streptomyces sp. T21Q-yed]WDF41381.1 helix-turn-helix transcriptional regulator [Streptomyces sp. T12]
MTADQPTQGNSISTVLGRRLGGELIKLRTAAGLTQTHAAKVLSASTTKVAKMERGWVPIRDPDIRALCELYRVHDPGVVGGLLELARVDRERRKAKGWWDDFTIPGVMQEYVALESAATSIKTWQPAFIPGLLQTPEYVRALRESPAAKMTKSPEPDDKFIAARLARQRRFYDDPPLSLRVVIYEAVLRNFPGGAATARGQLEELVRVADLPSVDLRIFPFAAGTHSGLNGSFNIISFAAPGAMDVVYVEAPFAQRWVEGGQAAAAYDELFEKIAECSLDERESVPFLHKLRKEL